MKVVPTVHTIVMRHPLIWHQRSMKGYELQTLYVWLDVWAHTLDLLRHSTIESFAVVNYEALVLYPNEVAATLSQNILEGCSSSVMLSSVTSSEASVTHHYNGSHRSLHMHQDQGASYYLKLGSNAALQKKCRQVSKCSQFMDDLAPIMEEAFGYRWSSLEAGEESSDYFVDNILDSSKVLFSSAGGKLPSSALVEKMKSMAKKYIN